MGNHKDKERGSYQRDQQGASDNHLSYYAQQALGMGQYSSNPGPAEAQQYSSTPAASGYTIQQPRQAPYQQGQLGGNTSSGGGYAGTAQYSDSAHEQTTEGHKRVRESSSSSGDQQHEHGRSHHKHGGGTRKHRKADDGSREHHHSRQHGSQRGGSQGGGRSHHEPRHQPENQGAIPTPTAPQYQPNPWQNTGWPTNAPATAGHGGGAGGGYGDDVRQPALPAGLFPPAPPGGRLPSMQLEPPRLAPMPSMPRQLQRRDLVPPMLTEPPHLAPFETQTQSGGLPSLQIQSQQRGPMMPPVPTWIGTGPAASHSDSDNSPDPFNVAWRGHIFDTSQERPTRGLTLLQLCEARVVIASFATWDEARELGQ